MNSQRKNNLRRIHYLDNSIQKWLLVALVTMEVMLIVVAMWMLNKALSDVIDQQMYQVHLSDKQSVFSHLLNEGMKILGVVFLVNLLALLVADRIWAYWVSGIFHNLMALINASLHLDFSDKSQISCNHDVLVHAMAWREAEFSRIEGLRHDIHALPFALPASAKERENIAAGLKKIMDALPAG